MQELNQLREEISRVEDLQKRLEDVELLLQLTEESDGGEAGELFEEAGGKLQELETELVNIETELMFSGKYDNHNAILSIHPGAGGLESQDWAEMLMRMYLSWAEKKGMEIEVLDYLADVEAGIKSVTLLIKGKNAYGLLKSEKGIHRLVRISPFDTQGRRHTSFASIDVVPEVEEEEFHLNLDDVKMDTFRAKGAGGQHVNTTDSAVRATHLPTGITAQCQNDRSQHSNRAHAIRILQARVAEHYRKEQEKELEEIRGEQREIAWGNQIRSYTFHPFTLVKDHRTGLEEGNVESVMDGRIDHFQEAYLRWIFKPGTSQGENQA